MDDQEAWDELTAEERRLFAELPRERDPGRLLEERTLSTLKDLGHLRTPSARMRSAGWGVGVAAAGAAAVFLGGVFVGQALAGRDSVELVASASEANAEQVPLLIQQTGSAYVAALARLAELPDATSDRAVRQGREVGVRLLQSAADELLRSVPDEQLASVLQAGLARHALGAAVQGDSTGTRRVIWF